ncbi:hypothetical protein GS425_08350 [Rhodococcus hoagii]|nr:hypothetical protein [Prescottella equi]
MRKEMPYYSTSSGADISYHVFTDCPIGARVERADRASGVGPTVPCTRAAGYARSSTAWSSPVDCGSIRDRGAPDAATERRRWPHRSAARE